MKRHRHMNNLLRFLSIGLCLLALPQTVLANNPSTAVPATLEVPSNQELAITLTGKGSQIYVLRAVPGGTNKFAWELKAPEADLFDASGKKVGRHFAGPTWKLFDGGKVIGHLRAKADAPDGGKDIPWLLLDAVKASGTMGKVKCIQRLDTVGGKAPAVPVDVTKSGVEEKVEYTAVYKFYVDKP
jgi:Protein of unknown function (DUF3455)